MELPFDSDIQYLTGVGPKRAALYHKLDIYSIRDLLYYFPRSYIDLTSPCDICDAPPWEVCAVRARIVSKSATQYVRKGLTVSRVKVADDTGSMVITFFNAKYTVDALKQEQEYLFYGKMSGSLLKKEMQAPAIYPADLPCAFIPVYPLTQGLSSKIIAANISQAVKMLDESLPDPIPAFIRQKYQLCHLHFALKNIHLPSDRESVEIARRRLIFEELLMLSLSLHSVRTDTFSQTSYVCKQIDLSPFVAQLPFRLTNAQNRAIRQVCDDLKKKHADEPSGTGRCRLGKNDGCRSRLLRGISKRIYVCDDGSHRNSRAAALSGFIQTADPAGNEACSVVRLDERKGKKGCQGTNCVRNGRPCNRYSRFNLR